MLGSRATFKNVGVLIACLPSAGNIYVLAEQYDVDPQRVVNDGFTELATGQSRGLTQVSREAATGDVR